ncbi:hypothetical protein [Gulosibacter faecalis]|uniref:Uncharacterized protein n=1 Tax=Gulosibacter faecalis TaxID=272240 RepID=A0ABW5UU43_9MICO|nr:hypothetical protein [Gulosibacter faecalis]
MANRAFADMLDDAKPGYDEINIVMDGTLSREREELEKALVAAKVGNGRMAGNARAIAQKALDEWDAAHTDDFATIRIYACRGKAEWLAIRQKHTATKNDTDAFKNIGYNPYEVAVEIVTRKGVQVMDDGTEADVPAEAWKRYFGEIVTQGDLELMTSKVMALHSKPSGVGVADRKK